MALLKYKMQCKHTDDKCNRQYFVLVDPEESDVPDCCPFCMHVAEEVEE